MRALNSLLAASVVLAAASAASAALIPIVNPGFTYGLDGNIIGISTTIIVDSGAPQTVTPTRMPFTRNTPGQWLQGGNIGWHEIVSGVGVQGWTGAGENTDWGNYVENKRGNTGTYDGAAFMSGAWNYLEQTANVNNITIQAGTYTLGLDAQQWDGANVLSAAFTATDALAGTIQNFSVSNNGQWSTVTGATLLVAADSPLIGQNLGFHINAGDNTGAGWLGAGGTAAHNPQIDNVSLDFVAAVPEPASVGLMAGAGLMMLSRRRNAAK